MSDELLLIERPLDGCTQITLNRPDAKNALSRELRRQLTAAIDGLNGRNEARVLILTGAGNAFCAGLDLKELGAAASNEIFGFEDRSIDVRAALEAFEGPILGAVNGPAITGGWELALSCDVLICSTSARFADTHARVGVMPIWGLSQRLSRAIGVNRALEFSLTGNFLTAEQAEAWGFVNRVVAPEQLMEKTYELAGQMLSVVPQMLVSYRRLIKDGFAMPLGDALVLERERGLSAVRTVDTAAVERLRHEVLARAQQQIALGN
jgi:enoyl-CoA hydratase